MEVTVQEWMAMLGDCAMQQDALQHIRISMGTVENPYDFPDDLVDDDLHENKAKENIKGGVQKEVAESLGCRRAALTT